MPTSLLSLHRELVEALKSSCIITLKETSVILDVHPETVRRMTSDGRLHCHRYPGKPGKRRLMFWLEDVLDLAESRLK